MAFGITAQGFSLKRLEDIKAEIEDSLKTELGPNINLLPEEILGQLNGIFAEREANIWELLQAVYFAYYPDSSEAVILDNVASITGAIRKTPTKSSIIGQLLFGTPGTNVLSGSVGSVSGIPTSRFVTLNDVILVAGTDEIQTSSFSADPSGGAFKYKFNGITSAAIDFDDTASEVQTKLEAMSSIGVGNASVTGTITAAGGLVITFLTSGSSGLGKRDVSLMTIEDNTLTDGGAVTVAHVETTPGVPQGSVNMEAESTGATDAPSGTLNVIETPIAGWDSMANPLDADIGEGVESDTQFKIRRDLQVAQAGAATPNAVFADLIQIEDVVAVVVFFNNLDIADLDGRPPHSVDIVVQGGDEDVIAQEIFDTVGGGITQIGDISKSVIDDDGFANTVKFSRPSLVDIYVEVDLVIDSDFFPVDGLTQVEAAILIYAARLGIGADVIVFGSDPSLGCSFDSVPGILDFTIRVGKTISPTLDANVEILRRELADFDSSRITVAIP